MRKPPSVSTAGELKPEMMTFSGSPTPVPALSRRDPPFNVGLKKETGFARPVTVEALELDVGATSKGAPGPERACAACRARPSATRLKNEEGRTIIAKYAKASLDHTIIYTFSKISEARPCLYHQAVFESDTEVIKRYSRGA